MHYKAKTRAEYIDAIDAMAGHPIIGEHTIGAVAVSVSAKRWRIADDQGNVKFGPVKSGPVTRYDIRVALIGWLEYRGIR